MWFCTFNEWWINIIPDLGLSQWRVNPIRIESCESFTRAKAFMSECVAITDDSSGSQIIKCEWLSSESLEG